MTAPDRLKTCADQSGTSGPGNSPQPAQARLARNFWRSSHAARQNGGGSEGYSLFPSCGRKQPGWSNGPEQQSRFKFQEAWRIAGDATGLRREGMES